MSGNAASKVHYHYEGQPHFVAPCGNQDGLRTSDLVKVTCGKCLQLLRMAAAKAKR